jgi:GST-like protein
MPLKNEMALAVRAAQVPVPDYTGACRIRKRSNHRMIDLYTWTTPNGHKIHIMLEETGLDYRVHGVDIRAGDQFNSAFLEISPNNRIPAIVDHDGPDGRPLSLFESGAILIYLAGKSGRFLPRDLHDRYAALQWLMWQMGGVGPMFGQANHFRRYAPEKMSYAIERYTNESRRLTGILDRRLGVARYLAGAEYSIADMAVFPWIRGSERRGVELKEFPNVVRWFDEIHARPAVQRGLQVLSGVAAAPLDDKARDIMFGKTQFERR